MTMGHLEPGEFVLLDCGETPRLWHMRLLLAPIQHTEFIVCTPDFDLFAEEVSLQNEDVSALRIMGRDGHLPPGVAGTAVYSFADPSGFDKAALLLEGRRLAAAERLSRGLGDAGATGSSSTLVPLQLADGPLVSPFEVPRLVVEAADASMPEVPWRTPSSPPGLLSGGLASDPVPQVHLHRVMPVGGGFVLDEPTARQRVGTSPSPPALLSSTTSGS